MVARVGRQMGICFPSHHTLFFARMQAFWESCSILYASKMIMRPERETKEHRDPCPGRTDCRYAEGPPREPGPTPENAAPHPRAAAQTCYGDDYASPPVARPARAIQCGWRQDHRQAYTPRISAPGTR